MQTAALATLRLAQAKHEQRVVQWERPVHYEDHEAIQAGRAWARKTDDAVTLWLKPAEEVPLTLLHVRMVHFGPQDSQAIALLAIDYRLGRRSHSRKLEVRAVRRREG